MPNQIELQSEVLMQMGWKREPLERRVVGGVRVGILTFWKAENNTTGFLTWSTSWNFIKKPSNHPLNYLSIWCSISEILEFPKTLLRLAPSYILWSHPKMERRKWTEAMRRVFSWNLAGFEKLRFSARFFAFSELSLLSVNFHILPPSKLLKPAYVITVYRSATLRIQLRFRLWEDFVVLGSRLWNGWKFGGNILLYSLSSY